jgi:hypothetical protein
MFDSFETSNLDIFKSKPPGEIGFGQNSTHTGNPENPTRQSKGKSYFGFESNPSSPNNPGAQ